MYLQLFSEQALGLTKGSSWCSQYSMIQTHWNLAGGKVTKTLSENESIEEEKNKRERERGRDYIHKIKAHTHTYIYICIEQ